MKLRSCINEMCMSCIYDEIAPGTWRQQVTLCADISCPLYKVRPKTDHPVPESVLSYYGVKLEVFDPQNEELEVSVTS